MRKLVIAACMALAAVAASPAAAQLSFGYSSGGVHLGVNIPVYPRLVPVPGYPVYYAPNLNQNYFFYDGLYWLFYDGNWYESEWYNGPWAMVAPDYVPLYVLRVPLRYYHQRPAYFRGYSLSASPPWHVHWGREWADRHRDWNRWDRRHEPARAPLPDYQRRYSGNRYPDVQHQREEHQRNYRYTPRDYVQHQQHTDRLMQRETNPRRVPSGHENPRPDVSRQGAARHEERIERQTGQQWHGNQPDPRRGSGPADSGGG